jgi:type III pantothenate kinase
MLLTCDIGNSKIKAGLFSGDELIETFSVSSIEELISLYTKSDISFTGISSVVPYKLLELKNYLNQNSFRYHHISTYSKFNLKIIYKNPETLGTDRLSSAEGAFFLNGPLKKDEIVLTIDFGTATTINVVQFPGEFIGGIIAPGIELMGSSLKNNTAQLPEVTPDDFENMIGNSTRTSIASGLLNSTVGMIDRFIKYLRESKQSKEIKIYLTGGNAEKIIPHLNFDFTFEKNLVHYGIKSIIKMNGN